MIKSEHKKILEDGHSIDIKTMSGENIELHYTREHFGICIDGKETFKCKEYKMFLNIVQKYDNEFIFFNLSVD